MEGGAPVPRGHAGRGDATAGIRRGGQARDAPADGLVQGARRAGRGGGHLEAEPGRAVVASSAGNHGLGLAYAASKLGARVTVVVPTGASAAKVAALQQFDVRLVLHGEGYREAETHALELAERDGSRYVSPYNDPDVIAGQATVVRELAEQVPNLGTVVVPCGGGGLLAGVILGLDGSGVRVIGVESEASPSMSTALAAGRHRPDRRRAHGCRRPGRQPRTRRGDGRDRAASTASRCGR